MRRYIFFFFICVLGLKTVVETLEGRPVTLDENGVPIKFEDWQDSEESRSDQKANSINMFLNDNGRPVTLDEDFVQIHVEDWQDSEKPRSDQKLNSINVHLNEIDFDEYFLPLYAIGVLLFYNSAKLSHNTTFYYVAAILLGIGLSFLILLYFMVKLLPLKKTVMVGVGISAAAASYFLQFISTNICSMIIIYQKYVFGYFALSALMSVILYYRFGPITDLRTKNLIKYALQVIGSAMIYNSSCFTKLIQTTLVTLFIVTNVPWTRNIMKFGNWIFNKFKPLKPRRLLTEDEYTTEGIIETAKAISQLREYCNSPDFYQKWQLILDLHDQRKFLTFLREETQFTPAEIRSYKEYSRNLEMELNITSDESGEEI